MRKFLACVFLAALAALAAPRAQAQSTTVVSATVTDPNSIPYALGTVKAQLTPSVGSPCVMTGGNCVPIQGTIGPSPMSPAGSFVMNLYPNASITPSGTQWLFTVCISPGGALPLGTGPQCFSSAQTISGSSQSLTTALSAIAPSLSNISVTIPTNPTFNIVKFSTLTSNTTNPAASGALRLENTDSVCWRNSVNNGDNCLEMSQAKADWLWYDQFAGAEGILASGFGDASGTIATDGLLKMANTDTVNWRNAANSGDDVLSVNNTDTLLYNGQPVISPSKAVQSYNSTTLASDISLTANTATNVIDVAVTMPSSGCPCRALVSYGLWWNSGSNNGSSDSWISDGTNLFGTVQAYWASTGNTGGQSQTALSPVDYANSANVTFTLIVETNAGGETVKAAPLLAGQNTWLTVSILTSN